MTKRAAFRIPDFPANRPRSDDVIRQVNAYYRQPGNGAGGNLHIVLDDQNTEHCHIFYCLERCREEADGDGARIAEMLLQMTPTQRKRVAHMHSCGVVRKV